MKRANRKRRIPRTQLAKGSTVIQIGIAEGPDDLEAIYRFRYRIYVREMNRVQKDADHLRQRIEDALDSTAINLVAREHGDVVGVARVNLSRDGNLGMYENFYAMNSVGADHPQHTSITTRLMVDRAHRSTILTMRLMLECYRFGLDNGIRWNFIDCNAHLVRFFSHAGFVRHLPEAFHDEYGTVTCMRLALLDEAHLKAVGSPFLGELHLRRNIAPRIDVTSLAMEL